MKRIIAVLMAAMLMLSLVACEMNFTNNTDSTDGTENTTIAGTTAEGTENTTVADNTAAEGTVAPNASACLDILNTVWATYGDEEKFPAAGGDMTEANMNMEGPGIYGLEDTEAMESTLRFPAASISKIDGAASMVHMMNANTFTCGAYHLVNAADKDALADELKNNIMNTQWMCGFPDKMVIVSVDDIILAYFGNGEIVDNFTSKLTTSYTQATTICEESLVA